MIEIDWTEDRRAQFRNSAAGLIKTLIRARAIQEPKFLKPADYDRWGVAANKPTKRSVASILESVSCFRNRFEEQYLAFGNSIPAPSATNSEIEHLRDAVASFITGDLDAAIKSAKSGKRVPWTKLANWRELKKLRDELDKLPVKEEA